MSHCNVPGTVKAPGTPESWRVCDEGASQTSLLRNQFS
jgi:hypothetical protein